MPGRVAGDARRHGVDQRSQRAVVIVRQWVDAPHRLQPSQPEHALAFARAEKKVPYCTLQADDTQPLKLAAHSGVHRLGLVPGQVLQRVRIIAIYHQVLV